MDKCLEFQEIKGLAGSSRRENVCVSSWSAPFGSISSCQGSCAYTCVYVWSGKTCLKGVEWNSENPELKQDKEILTTYHNITNTHCFTAQSRYDPLMIHSKQLPVRSTQWLYAIIYKKYFGYKFSGLACYGTVCTTWQHGTQIKLACWKPTACTHCEEKSCRIWDGVHSHASRSVRLYCGTEMLKVKCSHQHANTLTMT